MNIPCSRSFRRCFVLLVLALLSLFVNQQKLFSPVDGVTELFHPKYDTNAPPCTYDQLFASYGKLPENDQDSCWNLSDRILRIPGQAVVNWNELKTMGQGHQGVIYKAILQNHTGYNSRTAQHCSVALKSYLKKKKKKKKVCEQRWNRPCIPNKTKLKGDYLGSLVFYASQMGDHNPVPGVMPVWGLVVADDSLRGTRVNNSQLEAFGIIMPLKKFETLEDSNLTILATSTRHVARIMLPAAQGMEYFMELGLVHQDLVRKNIGVEQQADGQPTAFIFDYGHMAYRPGNVTCSLGKDCDFCLEPTFPTSRRRHEQRKDAPAFAKYTIAFLEKAPDRAKAKPVIESLKANSGNIHQIVRILKEVAEWNI